LLPREASRLFLETLGLELDSASNRPASIHSAGPTLAVADVALPSFAKANGAPAIVAVLAADAQGKLRPTARRTLDAAQFLTPFFQDAGKYVLVAVPSSAAARVR
jgi:hypothetical protein